MLGRTSGIRWVDEVTDDWWWDVARSCPYVTFFHTPLWHRLAARTYESFESVPIGAVTGDGTRVVLPLLRTRSIAGGLVEIYTSTFRDCYGGYIADGEVAPADERRLLDRLQADLGSGGRLTGNPFAGDRLTPPNSVEQTEATHLLRLEGDFDDIIGGFSSSHRNAWRKGRRRGVRTRLAGSIDDFRAYYGLYELSLRRWGDTAIDHHPWDLFRNGFELGSRAPEHMKLWLAEIDDSPVAGAWVFYGGRTATYWHGAADAEYFDHKPNNVLHVAIIRDALERGYATYDLGPSAGLEGVARFKRRFGAERREFRRWTFGALRRTRLVRRALSHAGGLRALPSLATRAAARRLRAMR